MKIKKIPKILTMDGSVKSGTRIIVKDELGLYTVCKLDLEIACSHLSSAKQHVVRYRRRDKIEEHVEEEVQRLRKRLLKDE